MKSYRDRLARLEALEAAQQPGAAYVCMHAVDYAALNDPATPAALRQAIADDYGMAADQKLYVGVCGCWSGESCRVCSGQPFIECNI